MSLVAGACAGDGAPPVPYATTSLPPLRELPADEARRYESLPWTLDSTDPSGTALTVRVPGGACRRIEGTTVRTTATTVVVTVLGATGGTCSAGGAAVVLVRLPQPVGDRSVGPPTP
ncbi:hypothetical protein [Micromonospora echinospora]|uniref:hypothetical protein n=1 Tax=Micromonospora echinospora TaxID=1877 RepID=UPI00118008FB|nr:hypothetical protein [Micromonospora echinospora]